MPILTSDQLVDRIDPSLAVDRILTPAERHGFKQFCLVGRFDGAQPADWIDEAMNADAYAEHIDPWWKAFGDQFMSELTHRHPLPEPLLRKLLGAAMYAVYGLASAYLGRPRRTAMELASDAALWTAGYAERCGWERPDPDAA